MGSGIPENPGHIQKGIVATRDKECLLTGPNGAFCLVSLSWEPRRKFHCFLAKPLEPGVMRHVLLSAIEEYKNGQQIRPEVFIPPNTFLTESVPVRREVFLDEGVKIKYRAESLEIRPYFNYRHMYDTRKSPGKARAKLIGNKLVVEIDSNRIELRLKGNFQFKPDSLWKKFEYDIDKERYEDWEDYNFSPGIISFDGELELAIGKAFSARQDFLVNANGGKAVIAGYPWFSPWTRDSMIYARYLIEAGRYDDVRKLLRTVYSWRRENLLPEFIDERTGLPVYKNLDSNLWFILVLYEYVKKSGDKSILSLIDLDGLLAPILGKLDGNLFLDTGSWMDAVHREKPVEIQGLVYNALLSTAELIRSDSSLEYETLATELSKTFKEHYLDDSGLVIDSHNDRRFRPNFLLLASFPFKILNPREIKPSLERAIGELVTPYGLRTLGPDEPGYFGRYTKAQEESYHNGTVWAWLTGPFYDSCNYAYRHGRDLALEIVKNLEEHKYREGVIGQINEIFDGDKPHKPRGCPAQAWSLSEIERIKLLEGRN